MYKNRQWLIGAVVLVVFLAMLGSSIFLYFEVVKVRQALDDVSTTVTISPKVADQSSLIEVDVTAAKKQRWSALQSQFQNAVLQVFSQVTEFNWIEPYKTPNQSEGSGSAFFINDKGDIITNAHVVNQAISVTVQVPSVGKRRFNVDIVGISPDRDLALLKMPQEELESLKKELKTEKLSVLKMGDSDAVHRGDKIMALGFPLGQQGIKSTTGVVSGREHLPMSGYFIQISAPINPGNSGGPSLDNTGRVIGVNTAGVMGAQNVGYIIPSNDVLLFLDQLGTIPDDGTPKLLRRPFLGVFFNTATDNLRAYLKNPAPGGLYVVDVYKGGPFEKAGIKAGDMIYSIDGYSVDMHGEMSVPWSKEDRISIIDYVARLKLGHEIKLVFYRNGKKLTSKFSLALSEPPIRRMHPGLEKIDYEILGGFVFMPITLNHVMLLAKYSPQIMQYADAKKEIEPALLITHVMLNSPASRLRSIGAGGILSEVNGTKVQTLEELREAVLKTPATGYLTIKTTDNQFVAIPLKEIMHDEERLSATYFYSLSPLYKDLKKLTEKPVVKTA